MANRRSVLIAISLVALVAAAVLSSYLLTRETQAERCERLGREAHEAEAALVVLLPDDGTKKEIDAAIERAEVAAEAYEGAGCRGIRGCDFEPPLYTKERCEGSAGRSS